jgi:hypothetical protein
MSRQWPGGLIRRTPPTVDGSQAKGVWTLEQATNYRRQGVWPTVPGAPTIGTATAGNQSASVAFTAPTNIGSAAITSYTATSSPGNITGTGASSPVTVTGLTNGTSYTFTVRATNGAGTGPASAASNSVTPVLPVRAVFGGGNDSSNATVNVLDYITIGIPGNAIDFGDLNQRCNQNAACSSSTRGVFALGNLSTDTGESANPDSVTRFITIATTGNTTSFGFLTASRYWLSGLSNSTRGLFCGGYNWFGSPRDLNIIDFITIASAGNGTDFGDLINSLTYGTGTCASTTRGMIGGGYNGSGNSSIQYVTIASTGNAIAFGSLLVGRVYVAGASNSTRGLFGGGTASGGTPSNVVEYVTIASTGNAIDFGDLIQAVEAPAAAASADFAVFAGGYLSGGTRTNVINVVTIATTGNASDFGDLTVARYALAGCSAGHGGL